MAYEELSRMMQTPEYIKQIKIAKKHLTFRQLLQLQEQMEAISELNLTEAERYADSFTQGALNPHARPPDRWMASVLEVSLRDRMNNLETGAALAYGEAAAKMPPPPTEAQKRAELLERHRNRINRLKANPSMSDDAQAEIKMLENTIKGFEQTDKEIAAEEKKMADYEADQAQQRLRAINRGQPDYKKVSIEDV